MQSEVFGPIPDIYTYKDFDWLYEFLFAKTKPLSLYIFSKSKQRINKLIKNSQSGTVCINDTVIPFIHPSVPFGGLNETRIGKSHGRAGFLSFSNERTIVRQNTGLSFIKLIYPPYTKGTRKMITRIKKLFCS